MPTPRTVTETLLVHLSISVISMDQKIFNALDKAVLQKSKIKKT